MDLTTIIQEAIADVQSLKLITFYFPFVPILVQYDVCISLTAMWYGKQNKCCFHAVTVDSNDRLVYVTARLKT